MVNPITKMITPQQLKRQEKAYNPTRRSGQNRQRAFLCRDTAEEGEKTKKEGTPRN